MNISSQEILFDTSEKNSRKIADFADCGELIVVNLNSQDGVYYDDLHP